MLVASCLVAVDLPPWFANREVAAADSVIGLGTGPGLEEARTSALADLVEQVIVDVTSERTLITTQQTTDGATTLRQQLAQRLRSSSSLRSLAGAAVVRQEARDGAVFLALGITYTALVAGCTARVGELDKLLAAGLGERPAAPTPAWIAKLRALLDAAQEREALAAVLASRQVTPSPTPLAADVVRNHLGGLARPAVLALEGDDGAPGLSAACRAAAGELGLAIAGDGAPATHLLKLVATATATRTPRQWHQVVLTGSIELVDPVTKAVLGRFATDVTATSTVDEPAARKRAERELAARMLGVLRTDLLTTLIRQR